MMNKSVLLIDPRSVSHGPPDEIKSQDKCLSSEYSDLLDTRISEQLHNSKAEHNWNAVSAKYISNYGQLMLGGRLKEKGYIVYYINGDYYFSLDLFTSAAVQLAKECEIICFTGTTPQYIEVKTIAEEIKQRCPEKLLVLGGPHTYFFRNHYEEHPFDLVIIGHDIQKAVDTIDAFYCQSNKQYTQQIVQSFGYTDAAKDFSLIPKERLPQTLLYSYVSFGCPNKCTYCIEHKFTKRICFGSFAEKIKEIQFLVNIAGVKSVHLADSDFFLDPTFSNCFLDALEKANIRCCFTVNTSPRTICQKATLAIIKRFQRLGLVEILVGVEYFSDKVLKRVQKEYSIDLFYASLSEVRMAVPNIIVSFYALLGLPGEDSSAISSNLLWTAKFWSARLYDFSFPKFFVPYPGTDVFENPEQYDARILHMRWNEYHRWFLPRPIKMNNLDDRDLVDELCALYEIAGVSTKPIE